MTEIRKAGIIGYGKMGRDIFDTLQTKMPDTKFVILVRHDADTETEKTLKNLSKALRRKKISEEDYTKLSGNFVFTDNIEEFSDCDFVLETISENPDAKKKLFAELDRLTDSRCVFATNTSSLKISDVFSLCSSERKTMGLHFFYPVKLSSYIELNDCSDTETGRFIAEKAGKKALVLNGDYCIYLNQYISFCIAQAFIITEKYGLSIKQSMSILSEIFPLHSLFGMVDSIGTGLLTCGTTDNKVERIRGTLDFFRKKLNEYNDDGCSPETGMFLNYISEKEKNIVDIDTDSEAFKLDLISVIINEAVIAASETDPVLTDALSDAVGLSDSFSVFYKSIGYDTISETLNSLAVSCIADRALFDKYLQ